MDENIREAINRELKVRGLPIECHHASWRDGGLAYPSFLDRKKILMIRSFPQMMLSRDPKIRNAMRWFSEDKRGFRLIRIAEDSSLFNWQEVPGDSGTACLVARTRKVSADLKVHFKLKGDEMMVKTNGSEYQTKTVVSLGRFLTQKVIRSHTCETVIEH
jgi:hypothetical protein